MAEDVYPRFGKNRASKSGATDLATMSDDEYYRLVTAHMDAIANDTSAGRAVPDNISAPGQTSDGLTDDEYFRMLERYVDEGAVDDTLANLRKNDILYSDDIQIGRSVGAKAANYDVLDFESGKMYHFTEGTKLQDVQVFAGKGTHVTYRNAQKYATKYGGEAANWQHVKAVGWIETADGPLKAEVHWSQCPGIGKYDFFVKR